MIAKLFLQRSAFFRHSIATLGAVGLGLVLIISDTQREVELNNRKLQVIVDGIAGSVDRQLQAWRLALMAMSASNALDYPYDLDAFSSESKKFASITDTNLAFYRSEPNGLTLLSHTRLPQSQLPKFFSESEIPQFFTAMNAVKKTGYPEVTSLFLGPIADEYLASIIIAKDGRPNSLEMLSLNFSSRDLSAIVSKYVLPENYVVAIFDRNGVVGGRSQDAEKFVGKTIPDWYREVLYKNDSGIVYGKAMPGAEYDVYRFIFRHLREANGWAVSLLVPQSAGPSVFIGPLSGLLFAMSLFVANLIAWLLGSAERKKNEVEKRYQSLTRQLLSELPGAVLRGRIVAPNRFQVHLCLGRLASTLVTEGGFKFEPALLAELSKQDLDRSNSFERRLDVRAENRIYRLFIFDIDTAEKAEDDFNIYILDVTDQRSAEIAAIKSARLAALGQMAATLAHEMSQPINVISLAADNAEAALRDQDLSGMGQKIGKIREFASKSRYLIDNLLSFARGDTTDRPVSVVDLRRAILLAAELTHAALTREQIELVLDLPSQSLFVRGQPIELENIFVNLIMNSVDAYSQNQMMTGSTDQEDMGQSRRRNRRIEIRVVSTQPDVLVSVKDHAGGIPEDILPRIFEPFITTKLQGHGTGLGLSFVIGHVRSWGGAVSVRNADGGAFFEIRLLSAARQDAGADKISGFLPKSNQ